MMPRIKPFKPHYAFFLRGGVLLLGVFLLSYNNVLQRFDLVIYDKIATLQQYIPSSDIVIVAIDEKSLQVLGRWPWSRNVHAEFINRLAEIGNNVVAFDVLFAEPDVRDPTADEKLGAAIATHGAVILPVIPTVDTNQETATILKPISFISDHATLAHADVELDYDGVARRVFLFAGISKPEWPTIGLAVLEKMQKKDNGQPSLPTNSVGMLGRWVRSNEAMISFSGPAGSFRQISYAQIFYDDTALASLHGKVIFVGMTAAGLGTRFATPVSSINHQPMSGIEWHANVFEMLRHDRVIHPASNFINNIVSVVWVLLMILIVVVPKKMFTLPALLVMIAVGLFCVAAALGWLHIWIPPSAALLGTVAIYPLCNWCQLNAFIQALFVSKKYSRTALQSVGDGVITTDNQDRVVHMNRSAEKILGMRLTMAQGELLANVFSQTLQGGNHHELLKPNLTLPLSGNRTIQCYLKKVVAGSKQMVRITRHLLQDDRGKMLGFVVVITDITEASELTQQVAHLASYDVITGLPNRSLLLSRLNEMTLVANETGKKVVVFMIALDNFKKINDALGYRAGDALLHHVAQRLSRINNKNDVLARWSGDEFVLLFNYPHEEQNISKIAQKILKTISQQFDIDGEAAFVTASIGISLLPRDGEQSEMVLERAGTAMYRVKDEGGNSFAYYSAASSVTWTRDRLSLETELRLALENGRLQVFYQPIFDIYQQRMVHIEALVRWPHPVRGLLSPGDFIPIAEQAGIIEQLGETVLISACNAAYDLQQLGKTVKVSVNVSPRQLLYGNFAHTVTQALEHTKLPANLLALEITENAIVNDIVRANEVLKKIKIRGVSIALDDFGTGYSSLSLLRELPLDIVKIDKSFIRAVEQNNYDLMITQAIIGLGKNLNLGVIAEGVETQRQMQILRDQHCYLQQGFYFSRPVPFDTLSRL